MSAWAGILKIVNAFKKGNRVTSKREAVDFDDNNKRTKGIQLRVQKK